MSDFLETVFHLDLQNDVPGIVECIRQSPNDSNLLFSALCQLLLRRQTRSAFIIAQHLLNMGNHHTVLGFAVAVGGYIFNLPNELSRGLNHLRAQSDIQPKEQQDALAEKMVLPILTHLLKSTLRYNSRNRMFWIVEILKAADPRFRRLFDWNSVQPPRSLGEKHPPIPQPSPLIPCLLPPTDAPPRRVVVVKRESIYANQTWPRPLEFESHLVSAIHRYGWQATVCSIQGIQLTDDYHTIIETCQHNKADLVILDEDLVLTKDPQEVGRTEHISRLRYLLPSLKVACVLLDAGTIHPTDLIEASPLFDVVFGMTAPDLSLWKNPALAHKILPMPLPSMENFTLQNQPPLVPRLLFSGTITPYSTFWLSAAEHLNLPIKNNWEALCSNSSLPIESTTLSMQNLAEATCCLNLATQLDKPCPVTDRCFKIILSGSLLVQESSADMQRYFVPGEHYLEFSTLAELSSIVQFIQENREEAEEIRQRGHRFAMERYSDEKLMGQLDRFLYFSDPVKPVVQTENRPKKIVTYEYISVHKWCKPASPASLLTGSENLVYFHDFNITEPPIDLLGLRARGKGYEDLLHCDESFIGKAVPHFDFQTHRVQPQSSPFIARLKNVRIESPGFSIFLDRHLVMEESYHAKVWSDLVINWYRKRGARRRETVPLDIDYEEDDEDHSFKSDLDIKYYIDRGIDDYMEGPAILISGPSRSNYHHWLLEMLPKLWCMSVIPELQPLPLILFEPLLMFQLETLAALNIPPRQIKLFSGKTLQVKDLIFPSTIAPGNFSLKNVSWLRENLLPAFSIETKKPEGLLYISRGKASSRRVLNEDHLIAELQSYGFQIVHLETMKVKDQLAAFHHAKVVIMPHGAAGINIIFAQPGAILIELVPAAYQHPANLIYASLNHCLYGCVVCEDKSSLEKRDLVVDVHALLKVVDRALDR